MTPKEKAKELFDKFSNHVIVYKNYDGGYDLYEFHKNSQKCALIAVDEILKLQLTDGYDHEFWQEVKQEIEVI